MIGCRVTGRRVSWCRATGLVWALTLTIALVGVNAPALAHPGGGLAPPHARFSADGDVVTIEWTAPADDAAHIGEAIGHFPPGTMEAYLTGPEDALPSDDEVAAFSRSDELETYLLEHIEVTQDGAACSPDVEVADDFLEDGAELHFTCPERITQVDARITVLHDQDPRYDTFGVDGTVWTVLFTSASPEHTWDATAAAADDRDLTVVFALLGGVVALLLLGWFILARRVRPLRRRPRAYGAGGARRSARGVRRRRRRGTALSAPTGDR